METDAAPSGERLPSITAGSGNGAPEDGVHGPAVIRRTRSAGNAELDPGRFYSPAEESWAALCPVQGTVWLLVFRRASSETPETLQGCLQIQRMQGITTGRAGFDRLITTAGASQIRRDHQAYGGPRLPGLRQDGIESHIPGKAFVILFRYQAKWLRLRGADGTHPNPTDPSGQGERGQKLPAMPGRTYLIL